MKITRLEISNFRTVASARLEFDGHTLLIGGNNVGKSTVCEAIDLVLGPDRLHRFPPVQEFDFYNGKYLDENKDPIPIEVEVVLIDLSDVIKNTCATHLEFWNPKERIVVNDIEDVDSGEPCLRMRVVAKYNIEEDEFEAESHFSHSPDNAEGEYRKVSKNVKRLCGFLYLRTIRTGARALSLERGSLLDVILKAADTRAGLWESTLDTLSSLDPPIDDGAADLKVVLDDIESRISNYVALNGDGRKTRIHVSNLTREHLRKTLSFFLVTSENQEPVPFQNVGTGTLNALVLALLSYIGDLKGGNIIFAMEEPEMALPPHTQRRIINYLLKESKQCFVTSHSPYVIEGFEPSQISILRKTDQNVLSNKTVDLSSGLKSRSYHRNLRQIYAEAMLSNAVIVCEGITEVAVLKYVAERYIKKNPDKMPFDLSGISILSAGTDGQLLPLGKFFKSLDIPAYAFCDKNPKVSADDWKNLNQQYNHLQDNGYKSMEKLLVEELPIDVLWEFIGSIKDDTEINRDNKYRIPAVRPNDKEIQKKVAEVLKNQKGTGASALILEHAKYKEIPSVITKFIKKSHEDLCKTMSA